MERTRTFRKFTAAHLDKDPNLIIIQWEEGEML